jgi:hypothetical protein
VTGTEEPVAQDAVFFFLRVLSRLNRIRLDAFARTARVGLSGLGLRMDRLNISRTADLQTDEGLEWIARELAAGTSAMPSAIVDSEEISLVKISN